MERVVAVVVDAIVVGVVVVVVDVVVVVVSGFTVVLIVVDGCGRAEGNEYRFNFNNHWAYSTRTSSPVKLLLMFA